MLGLHESLANASFEDLHQPLGSHNETFENIKVTKLLGMISGMPKLPKFQS